MSDAWRKWLIEDNYGEILRSASISIIDAVEKGDFLDKTIDRYFRQHSLGTAQKGLIYEITSGVVKWKGFLDWVLSHFVKGKVKQDIKQLLRITLYQIRFMKKAPHHVVKEAVDYAKQKWGQKVANFVNAVIRRSMDNIDRLTYPDDPRENLTLRYSYPSWLVKRWLDRFGYSDTTRLLSKLNENPEFALRVNTGKVSRDFVANYLSAKDIAVKTHTVLGSALIVERLVHVIDDTLFSEGHISVQGEASQLAGMALMANKGDMILDACCGLGTKTQQIVELYPNTTVIALDNDTFKLRRMIYRDRKCVLAGDILQVPLKKNSFDLVLLDAPCSSLGIIRKHPEIRWRRAENDIYEFSILQGSLLRKLWPLVRTGGSLVYSVCSFEPEETVEVIESFGKNTQFLLEKPLPFLFNNEYFLSFPHITGMDGFFIARLKKL